MRQRRTTAHEQVLYFEQAKATSEIGLTLVRKSRLNRMIEDAAQAPLSVARRKAKHVWKNLIQAGHPVVLVLDESVGSSAHME